MKLPRGIIIPDDKLTRYLLVFRIWDDKSKFLAKAGFTQGNPDDLKMALIALAERYETVDDGINEYGTFLRTDGKIVGPNGRGLPVTAIWLRWHGDGSVHFVTLKPGKEDPR
ncbi:MAG: hypothetical protein HY804_08990 [Nitrospinae bacterium]|nr:hypothetical protein [Nitrospinota bacterium]